MNINSRSVRFISFIVGLIALFSFNISAQNKVSAAGDSTKTCAGKFVMPASIEAASDVFGDYLRVASLPEDKRRSAFLELSNEKKASYAKVCGVENGCVSTTSGCGPYEWFGCHYQCVPV